MSNPTEEQVEAAAKALRDDHANRVDGWKVPELENLPHGFKIEYRGKARAALVAAACVPVQGEPVKVQHLKALGYVDSSPEVIQAIAEADNEGLDEGIKIRRHERDAAPDGQVIIPIARIQELRAAKDAALAAVERVRAIHPNMDGECHTCSDENGPKSWPCDTIAALDGAPEPEWEYACREVGELEPWSCSYESRKALKNSLAGLAVRDDEEVVRRRKAGPWLPVEGESK